LRVIDPVRAAAEACLAAGRSAIVVEVIDAKGSVPRDRGTRMLVTAEAVDGTVGGGHLEWKAIATAREMLRSRETAPCREHFPLGPKLGQCCGGAVTLGHTLLDAEALAAWPVPPPRFHLQLYGAGHVGRAVATLLATLDVAVDWIDEREEEFPATTTLGSAWPGHIRRICIDTPEAEVRHAPEGAFYLVLTHNHDLDQRIVEQIMRRGDFGWLGLIGSKTKRAKFVHRLESRRVPSALIERMVCPVGLEGIEGKEPELIAVAAVAQMLLAGTVSPD
jgi:xanthine dehydrogenase accessory factor